MGGVREGEEVRVVRAERGAEVHGEAEVGGEVSELGHQEAMAGGHEEEAVELGSEPGREFGPAQRGEVVGEGVGGRGERDGEGGEGRGEREGDGGVEEAEDGRVAEHEGHEWTVARDAEEAAAAAEHAEREEAARLGEEQGEELSGEAEAAGPGRVAVQRRAADQLRRRDGPRSRCRWWRRRGAADGSGEGFGSGCRGVRTAEAAGVEGEDRVVRHGEEGERGGRHGRQIGRAHV